MPLIIFRENRRDYQEWTIQTLTLTTLGTKDTGRRQTKQTITTERMSTTNQNKDVQLFLPRNEM